MKKLFQNVRLKTKLIFLIFTVFILAIISENIYIIHLLNRQYYEDARQNVKRIANIISSSNEVVYNIEYPTLEHRSAIQKYAEQIRLLTQVEFITIFDMNGIRFSHPNVDKIGKHIVGGMEMRHCEVNLIYQPPQEH